ncbi:hypothetical protein R1flu_014145 [Riccia fluitans]|uniref:XS domain-containing protein n=1 Tax=Riccia fluitans TaxID=41844 RepID=A0ABD1YGC7_9MARC
MASEEEEKAAIKKLVISVLAYYGLQVFHVFDGRDFKSCFKLIEKEEVDKETALKDFTEVVDASGFGIFEKFVEEFCHPDLLATSATVKPAQFQSQFVPDPIRNLLALEMAALGNLNLIGVYPRIWAAFSTFTTDDFGHYVSYYSKPKAGEVDAQMNVQHPEALKANVAKMEAGVLVQFMTANYPAEIEAASRPYSPTRNNSPFSGQAGSDRVSSPRWQEESGYREGKRLKLEAAGEQLYEERQPGLWRQNLAKEWPHIFYEIEQNEVTESREEELEEEPSSAHLLDDLPVMIEVDTHDLNNVKDKPFEKKRKRSRGTDEKVSGETILYDSSLMSIGGEEDQRDHNEISQANLIRCAGLEEEDVKSEAGSNQTSLNMDLEDTGRKRNKSSWPIPLYGDQTRAKSSLTNVEPQEEEEDTCTHKPHGKDFYTCPICKKKEEIAFSKYSRLFKDDPTWKQKFLDEENLTCDICSSKGKINTFSDIWFLLSHGWRGFDLRGPEHRGYAKAIENFIQLCEPGNTRSCHSSVGITSPVKSKRVWPPVVVLENTFRATDQCLHLKNLENEVSTRLKEVVNIDVHVLHKIMVRGTFEGTILVELPPTRRGLHDANRLHHHFLHTGRSFEDWVRVRDERLSLKQNAAGVEETFDLVKIGKEGKIKSRIYFGYLATAKMMTRLDTFRHLVKWRFRDPKFVDSD